jgi:hypothetical protein
MPLNEELEALLDEIKRLDNKQINNKKKSISPVISITEKPKQFDKKAFLLETEKKAYFEMSHYFKIVLMSIDDPGTGLEVWLKGVLPILLTRHSLDLEEWSRICNIGDNDTNLAKELEEDWKVFFLSTIKKGQIDTKILSLINEGRKQVDKIRKTT